MDTPAPHPDSASPDPDDSRELVATVRVDGEAARGLRRAAAFQQRPVDDVAADCVRDELDRDVYDVLYTNVDDYASTLDGLSQRLALLIRELGALPTGDAAKVIAQAAAEKGGHLPDPWHDCSRLSTTDAAAASQLCPGTTAGYTASPARPIGAPIPRVGAGLTPIPWGVLLRRWMPGCASERGGAMSLQARHAQ
ncbi:hypothetical protein [Streptomyces sp. NPDC088178]|uniref:hypothetical protein n=1 Tax=Streptomyces sp. NPDC088178 TaxID=3365836 RepID=UPI003803C9EB